MVAQSGVLPENRCAKLRPPLEFQLVAATVNTSLIVKALVGPRFFGHCETSRRFVASFPQRQRHRHTSTGLGPGSRHSQCFVSVMVIVCPDIGIQCQHRNILCKYVFKSISFKPLLIFKIDLRIFDKSRVKWRVLILLYLFSQQNIKSLTTKTL